MPEHARRGAPAAAPLPPRVTTPLLNLITQQSMDEDYLLAAERRVLAGGPAQSRRPSRAGALVLVLFGALVATAGVQTARNADVDDASRNTLVARIEDRRTELAARQERIAALQRETASLEESVLTTSGAQQRATSELRRLQSRTGFGAVAGPGIRVTADDPKEGLDRIYKEDLFLLVNGLWQAGAEAITLNGRRLTVQTSINNSGSQINVETDSVRAPYTLLAIGNPGRLQANFVETASFARFSGLRSQYGFRLSMEDEESLELPAARLERLVSVEDVPGRRDRANEQTLEETAP
ncbi:DUF881 domain-containing protein [Nocardioides pantholopis]|uniref:DUF881 domain-containing protein n=1 Tax=Nocardioides pantholopis TaxID=2483798 RepID=UPI000F077165|nr:DUF881 domain-containing protein [Nocardioides pantholopis]